MLAANPAGAARQIICARNYRKACRALRRPWPKAGANGAAIKSHRRAPAVIAEMLTDLCAARPASIIGGVASGGGPKLGARAGGAGGFATRRCLKYVSSLGALVWRSEISSVPSPKQHGKISGALK